MSSLTRNSQRHLRDPQSETFRNHSQSQLLDPQSEKAPRPAVRVSSVVRRFYIRVQGASNKDYFRTKSLCVRERERVACVCVCVCVCVYVCVFVCVCVCTYVHTFICCPRRPLCSFFLFFTKKKAVFGGLTCPLFKSSWRIPTLWLLKEMGTETAAGVCVCVCWERKEKWQCVCMCAHTTLLLSLH